PARATAAPDTRPAVHTRGGRPERAGRRSRSALGCAVSLPADPPMLTVPDWSPTPPLHTLRLDWLAEAGVELAVLRLDLIDAELSGNKWYKLRPHLELAARAGRAGVMTLGGSHSNHLHAVAAAGARFGFATVGLLRGEPCDTPTVRDLQAFGMHLHWLGYGGYRARHRADFWESWRERYPELHPVPEGGGGLLGEAGGGAVYGARAVPDDHGGAVRLAETFAAAGVADTGYPLLDASRGGFARVDAELAAFLHASEVGSSMTFEPLSTAK